MALQASRSPLDRLAVPAAAQVRALTGFDRVMVYRFDAEWNGQVVAEEQPRRSRAVPRPALPGLRHPRAGAAALHANWLRLIADIAMRPVPIVPGRDPAPAAARPVHSTLRSVSPIHLEYLRTWAWAPRCRSRS